MDFVEKQRELLNGVSLKELSRYFEEVSTAYRERKDMHIERREEALSYLVYRAPATLGVLSRVLEELPEKEGPLSICDCGAGLGTSLFALDEESLSGVTLLEQSEAMLSLGKELTAGFTKHVWKKTNFSTVSFQPHDVFLFSYSLNELPVREATLVAQKAFLAASYAVVIIEPGTPEGYARILEYREALIERGAFVAAPCPHERECPLREMLGEGRWCHFSVRIERTREHMLVKGGSLGYEDEKYAYLIVTKSPPLKRRARCIRSPHMAKNAIELTLCGEEGIETVTATKREKELFKIFKKRRWGDSI